MFIYKLQCIDGKDGNGICVCDEGFMGFVCDMCFDLKKFGLGCNQSEFLNFNIFFLIFFIYFFQYFEEI